MTQSDARDSGYSGSRPLPAQPLRGLKICMVTSAHPPDDDRIFFKEARSLAKSGALVTVLCPEGKPAPAKPDGVRFERFAKPAGLFGRVLALGRIAAAARRVEAQVIHCHEPDALVAGLRLKCTTGAKLIYDSHELWSAVAAGRFPRPLWPAVAAGFRLTERRWIRQCDAAIAASWAIADYLRTVLPGDRVATILNVPVPEVFGAVEPREWGDTTVLCHDGHLGFDRGLKTMCKAVRLVAARHKVVFKIVGDVFGREREWLDAFVNRHGMQGVIVRTGWLPYEQVGRAIASCHIGLIALQHLPNNVPTSSNKVFNYMLYGIPFVAPDFRLSKIKLVQDERCGVLADSSSPESYANAIMGLIAHREATLRMGHDALKASQEKYRWEHMEGELVALYGRLGALPAATAGTTTE